jgi:cytochrome c oxidase subunit 2
MAHKGYTTIPTGDPNVVKVMRDGEVKTITSNPDKNTPPSMHSDLGHMMPYSPEVDEGSFWMPRTASETSKDVDAMFNFIMWTCYIFGGLIGVLMVVFCIKYRRRPGVRADQSITHNTPLEIVWSVIPTILVAIMFWGGYVTFLDLRTPPPDTLKVNVTGYRWGWDFTYQNGVQSPSEFHVPANTPIEMVMTSTDVLHSFHVPAFRAKSDVLPNRYTKIWFNSGEPGVYRVYCTEYCGKAHSNMYAKMVVEPREDYEAWLAEVGNWMVDKDGNPLPALDVGELTYTKRACKTCHSIDGSPNTGPTFAGLWMRERQFEDGSTAIADENYIRQSITDPHSQLVVEGDKRYGKQMTIYNPMLPEEQIAGIIAYIESLKDVPRKY